MKYAIVRPPSSSFASGLTSVDLGQPDLELAKDQHRAYCNALEDCGLSITVLDADDRFPDSTFVEDTAVLTSRGAIITRPGATSRRGEIDNINSVVRVFFSQLNKLSSLALLMVETLRCRGHFFIGLSKRTNRSLGPNNS
jgi:dimethylargininase